METTSFYRSHIFCCINGREKGSKRGCCASKDAEELQSYFKDRVKKLGLSRTRVNKSGCLDRCELGPAIVIYPEGIWYSCKTKSDVDEIIDQHLVHGKTVTRLLMPGRDKDRV